MRIAGSWTIGRPFGVPIRIHWSVPLCALLAGATRLAGGGGFAPGASLAFLLLVIIHEAGHAFVVRRVGARPIALEVLGFGGLCQWQGSVTPLQRAYIAWGGIWAQMLVFVAALIAVLALGRPANWFADQMLDGALGSNLWLMAVNLLPIPPLDGKEAWSLFPLLRRRLAERRAARVRAALHAHFVSKLGARIPDRSHLAPAPARDRPAERGAILFIESDDIDERDYTPEVREVLERTRAIARAALDPTHAGRAAGPDEGGSDKP